MPATLSSSPSPQKIEQKSKKRIRWTEKPLIPNEELRWFIGSVASVLREKGGYSDGYTSHGEPDPCPYTARELGAMGERGMGTIERAGECYKAWSAIGREHRDVLAAYYSSLSPGCTDPTGMSAVVEAMGLTPVIAKAARGKLEIAGVMRLMAATSDKDLVGRSNRAVYVAHFVWEIERARIEKPSEIHWNNGDLACPSCQAPTVPGKRVCACGHEFWGCP